MSQSNETEIAKKTMEEVLRDAIKAADKLSLVGERAEIVRLAVKTLLVIRGALHPAMFKKAKRVGKILNPYPLITKYIRASNAETLGGLVDDVLRNISPDFLTLQAAGEAIPGLFTGGTMEDAAVSLLNEETIPVVMLMKSIYQQARGFDEADQMIGDEEEVTA